MGSCAWVDASGFDYDMNRCMGGPHDGTGRCDYQTGESSWDIDPSCCCYYASHDNQLYDSHISMSECSNKSQSYYACNGSYGCDGVCGFIDDGSCGGPVQYSHTGICDPHYAYAGPCPPEQCFPGQYTTTSFSIIGECMMSEDGHVDPACPYYP